MLGLVSGSGKFWGTMSIWKVVLVFAIANVVMQLIGVMLREGLGIGWITPSGAAGGASAAAVLIVIALANKQARPGAGS